jgi:hypothetical protein
MPHENNWEQYVVVESFRALVTGKEFVRSWEAITGAARFDELRFIITDFSAIEGHGIDHQTMEAFAAIRHGSMFRNPNFRVVFAGSDDDIQGNLAAT